MGQVASGDRDGFESLYLELAPGAYGIALGTCRDRAMAENIIEGVFVTLWRQAPSFGGSPGSLRAWVMANAYHRAVDAAQGETRPPEIKASDGSPAGPASGADTDQQWLAIALALFGGLTLDEVAQVIGLPATTAATHIRDGLHRFSTNEACPTEFVTERKEK